MHPNGNTYRQIYLKGHPPHVDSYIFIEDTNNDSMVISIRVKSTVNWSRLIATLLRCVKSSKMKVTINRLSNPKA